MLLVDCKILKIHFKKYWFVLKYYFLHKLQKQKYIQTNSVGGESIENYSHQSCSGLVKPIWKVSKDVQKTLSTEFLTFGRAQYFDGPGAMSFLGQL